MFQLAPVSPTWDLLKGFWNILVSHPGIEPRTSREYIECLTVYSIETNQLHGQSEHQRTSENVKFQKI